MMKPDQPTTALTPKQRRFVEEYLLDMCAGKAAARAGYSEKTAIQQGYLLLNHPGVMDAINAAKLARSERTEIDADWMLQRLVAEAEADLADLYDDKGALKPVDQWPLIWRQGLVAGVETDELFEGSGENRVQIGYVKKIRLSDRVRRLELIGKHVSVNAFQETVNVTGLEGLADRIARAKSIAAERSKVIDHEATDGDDDREDERPDDAVEAARPHAFAPLPEREPKPPGPTPKPVASHRTIVKAAAPWPSKFEPVKTDYDPLQSE